MTVVALNAATLGVCEWDLAWLDVVEHEGSVYGLTATGIARLEGTDDDGSAFAAYVESGDLDLAPGASVGFGEAQLRVQADARTELRTSADQNGVERAVVYGVPARQGEKEQNRVVKLGRGVSGNAWRVRFGSSGQEACAWSLSGLMLKIATLRTRRR